MRISRWYALLAVAIVASLVVVPTVALAAGPLLTNEWGQSFLGSGATTADPTDGCISCHGSSFNNTTHGQFARTSTSTIEPSVASGMWAGQVLRGEIDPTKVFSLGGGTGLREYLVFGEGTPANGPFGVAVLEWDPSEPSLWEVDGAAQMEFEDYACNQCHMLGAVKKGVVRNSITGSANTWALPAGADPAVLASYVPGIGIQCERCHGTGVAAAVDAGGHWGTGVKVVGRNTGSDLAKVSSGAILNSEVCGQCHGSFKSGGNIAGYTPDKNINAFVTNPYKLSDVPDKLLFETSSTVKASAKFYPSGQNKGNKHSYYTEWALSGHSVRTFYSKDATDSSGLALTTPYQQSGASHFSNASPKECKRCHTGEGYLKRKGAKIMSGWVEGVDPAGKIGQECAVCHVSHGDVGATDTASAVQKNEAVGMAVRAPEKANGDYSTKGLNVDNQSICEDCHNWQSEVLGTTLVPVSSGRAVSHPQREVLHGRAFFEVAPADKDFMPGAKCEQCHMPATRSDFPTKTGLPRYEDRSWKRYSHRMFIMLPGDAEAWGLAPWGDSCSPCHAGESQSQLQANIDEWQSTAAALDQQLLAEITAAKARPEASGAGKYLVEVAYTNEYAFGQDGSGGVHNPPYIQAALKKSIDLAKSVGGSVTLSAPVKVTSGALFGIAGMVMNGDGTHAAGVTVKLYDGATLVGTSVTDASGNYAFAYAQTAAKTYTVKWARSSKAASDLSVSATVAMDVAKVATDLDVSISRTSVTRGGSYTLSGDIDPDFAAPILVQYKAPGTTTYRTLTTVTASSTGSFKVTRKTSSRTTRGTWTWRVKFAGDATHLGSSATAKIVVR